jgi:hypothetical protein
LTGSLFRRILQRIERLGLRRPQGFPEWLLLTCWDVLGRVDELARSVDSVTGEASGPYRRSRLSMLSGRVPRTLNPKIEEEIE